MAAVLTPPPVRRRGRPRLPGALRWASRIQSWSPALWLALQAAALWPAAQWAAGLLRDGPAQAPGLMLLGALLMAGAGGHLACHWPARTPWLLAAAGLTVAATTLADLQRPWPGVALSAGAMLCAWAAFRRPASALLPAWPLRWPGAAPRRRQGLRTVEQAMRQLQRAAAWKCAYAAVLIGCGLGAAAPGWRG